MSRSPIDRGSTAHLVLGVCCAAPLLPDAVAARARRAAERHGVTGPTDRKVLTVCQNLQNARLLAFGNTLTADGENLLGDLGPWRPT